MEDSAIRIPWDQVMPVVFFGASAICWYDPPKAPALIFFFLAAGILFFETLASYFTKPTTDLISNAMTDSLSTFSDAKNKEQSDRLLDAFANSIGRVMQSDALMSTLKRSMIETANDDELQHAAIEVIQNGMEKAAENREFQETFLEIGKLAFVGALSDKTFIKEAMDAAVAAMVTASQDEVLRQSILSVTTQAVSDALNDDKFVNEIRNSIKGCLSDGGIYRAGARGVMSAAFGGGSKKE